MTILKRLIILSKEDNIAKIILKYQMNNCNKIFIDCKFIGEIQFANFEVSNITEYFRLRYLKSVRNKKFILKL